MKKQISEVRGQRSERLFVVKIRLLFHGSGNKENDENWKSSFSVLNNLLTFSAN